MADHPSWLIPDGAPVTWPYRGTHGWGYVDSVARLGTTNADTLYNVRQVDHHISADGSHEPAIVQHTGAALRRSTKTAVEQARIIAEARAKKAG